MYRRWCYAQVCDALHSNYVLLDLKVMYYVSSEPPTERPKDQKLATTRKEVLVKANSNRYNEVVEIQAKGTLTLCRLKVNSGIEEVERPRGQKATKKVQAAMRANSLPHRQASPPSPMGGFLWPRWTGWGCPPWHACWKSGR